MAIKTVRKEVPDETYKHKTQDKKMEVYREQNPVSPRTWEHYGTMVCQHKRYNLGDREPKTKQHQNGWKGVQQEIRENNNIALILPLYLYDHSQITISTTSFRSKWDSGQVGFIYVTENRLNELGLPEEKRNEDDLRKILESEVNTYDQYLRGDVWRYRFYNEKTGEEEMCGGFYGDNREQMFESVGEDIENYERQK